MIEWYPKELQELEASPLVTLLIHSTRSSSTSSLNDPKAQSYSPPIALGDSEKAPISASSLATSSSNSAEFDVEKHPEKIDNIASRKLSIVAGRPSISNLITSLAESADSNDRIAVAACGPESMMSVTRKTVAKCISPNGPSMELFCEQFGF